MSDKEKNMELEVDVLSDDDLESVVGGLGGNTSGGSCNTSSGTCETTGGDCNTSGGTCTTTGGDCNTSGGSCDNETFSAF